MENDDNLFVKIMIVMLFLAGLLVGLAISSGKEHKTSYNRQDSFLTSYNSPLFIKSQTLASMSEDIEIVLLAERIIQCESSWRADAKNPSSSAYGLGQFITPTWNYVQKKWGIELDRDNPEHQMYAVVRLLSEEGTNHWKESRHCWDK